MRHILLGFCGWLLLQGPVSGHDLWLIPATGSKVGEQVLIRAHSGMKFPQSDHAPNTAKFRRRLVVLPNGQTKEVTAQESQGKSGQMVFTPESPGIHIVAVETTPRILELDAEAFNAYLVSDGLPHIYRLRAEEKTLHLPAKERYSKSPKALVRIGQGQGDPCRALGLPLEIVPLHNPFDRKPGQTLRVQVLFQGQPLPEANLGWDHPGGQETPRGTVRTDVKGEALIPLTQPGMMTIRLTHMTRPKTKDYEWESFWTTLTFEVSGEK